jgi:lipopolysaccharide/colanic/teichoic acid biosynthesis glycosyltransferase
VIKGDMSIVGPRPEMEMFIKQCEGRIPFYRLRLAVKPGITGWAQVWYYHTSTLAGYRNKFKYDLYYLANLSLKLDLEIVVRTIFRIFGYPKIDPRG